MSNATDRLKGRIKAETVLDDPMALGTNPQIEEKRIPTENQRPLDLEPEKLTIEEEKQQKKFLFQLVSHLDGKRSEPFIQSWDGLTKALVNWRDEEPDQFKEKNVYDDFILLVAVLDDKETTIPATPLITIKTYLQTVGKEIPDNG